MYKRCFPTFPAGWKLTDPWGSEGKKIVQYLKQREPEGKLREAGSNLPFIKCWQCTRYGDKHLTSSVMFNLYKNPMKFILLPISIDEETEA